MVLFLIPAFVFIVLLSFLGFILLPLMVGSTALTVKLVQLLFFTKVGAFPMWALFIVLILGFVLIRKSQKKGY